MNRPKTAALAIITAALLTTSALIAAAYSGAIAMYSGWGLPSREQSLQDNLVRLVYNAARYGSKGMDTAGYVVNATSVHIAYAVTGWGGYLDPVHIHWDSHGVTFLVRDAYGGLHTVYAVIDGSGDYVFDNDIYDYHFTGFHPVRLVVNYACYQGREIGGVFPVSSDEVRHYGMPQAWLYMTALSHDGYMYPDGSGRVFIGWENEGPFLSEDLFGNTDTMYKFFVRFYTKLYGYYAIPADNVNEALDEAAVYAAGDPDFYSSPLYRGLTFDGYETRLVVYGDGTYGSGPW